MSTALPDPERMSELVLRKKHALEVPVDVEKVLTIWNDLELVHEDLDGSGYLLPLGRLGGEIIVNKKDPIERRRFTIAHELGHWVLGQICKRKSGEFHQPPGVPYAAIEKWCDRFAASILMPRPLLEPRLERRKNPLFIDTMLSSPSIFKVSEEAFFIRVWELFTIQIASLRLRGVSSGCEVIRNFGGENSANLLAELFKIPEIEGQLGMTGPAIFFSGAVPGYRFHCSGRPLRGGQIIVSICWDRDSVMSENPNATSQISAQKLR